MTYEDQGTAYDPHAAAHEKIGRESQPLQIDILGDLQRLKFKPGDRFVLMSKHDLSVEQMESIQQVWKDFFDGEAPMLLVLGSDFKLGAVGCEAVSSEVV